LTSELLRRLEARDQTQLVMAGRGSGLPVVPDPVEVPAIGNALVQAQVHGAMGADRWAAWASVADRMELHVYQPSESQAQRWGRAEALVTGP
jgi:hypothetical protein